MKAVTIDTTAGGIEIVPPGNYPFIHIYNNGAVTLYVRYDGSPATLTTTVGMPIAAGAYLVLNNDGGGKNPFIHGIRGITASSSVDVRVQGDD